MWTRSTGFFILTCTDRPGTKRQPRIQARLLQGRSWFWHVLAHSSPVCPGPQSARFCRYDVCACMDGEECLCSALATYAAMCTTRGVLLDWRSVTRPPCFSFTLMFSRDARVSVTERVHTASWSSAH
ncbi:hypothetical protein CRUP_037961 [Coryphaenoides rupestris]|nr:hypothetical protein CRUP_037961 [Coryphaenoides rupestris]